MSSVGFTIIKKGTEKHVQITDKYAEIIMILSWSHKSKHIIDNKVYYWLFISIFTFCVILLASEKMNQNQEEKDTWWIMNRITVVHTTN